LSPISKPGLRILGKSGSFAVIAAGWYRCLGARNQEELKLAGFRASALSGWRRRCRGFPFHPIDAAWRAADLPGLAAAAHRLKGAAQAIGATPLGAAAGRLEQAGKAGDRDGCRDRLGPLAAELRRAIAEIQS
jgi:hypothetical protein